VFLIVCQANDPLFAAEEEQIAGFQLGVHLNFAKNALGH
jgi:hypothetical protein